MKSRLIFFLVALGFLMLSCKRNFTEKNIAPSKKIVLTPNTFDFIGKSHNQGLDYVFETTFKKNRFSTFDDIKTASITYIFDINDYTKFSKDDRLYFSTPDFIQLIKKAIRATSINLDEIDKANSLTKKQREFVKSVGAEVTNTCLRYDEIVRNIEELEQVAIRELGDEEIIYALCVSSIAKFSIEYWNTSSGEKWFTYFGKPFYPIGTFNNDRLHRAIDWHNVALADIIGFGQGFPAGVTVGMLAGGLALGVPTWGGATAIGAVLGGFVGGTATGLARAVIASAAVLAGEILLSWVL
jgi:hypothetical protein